MFMFTEKKSNAANRRFSLLAQIQFLIVIGCLCFGASVSAQNPLRRFQPVDRFEKGEQIARQMPTQKQTVALEAAPDNFSPDAPGDLDPTFGTGGKVITDFTDDAFYARQVEVQPDGKIVALGWLYNINGNLLGTYLIRYNPNGAIDNSFGTNGVVRVSCQTECFEDGFVILPDGKILIAGDARVSNVFNFAVFRLNPNGTRDATWGANGAVTIPIVSGSSYGYEIVVQPDGKIVIFGEAQRGNSANYDIGIARLNANGTIDISFGTNGISVVQIPNAAGFNGIPEVRLQTDGKFLFLYESFGAAINGVVRVNPTGTLDTTFASGGLLAVPTYTFQTRALALQPDGKFVLVTRTPNATGGTQESVVSRYNPNGTLDDSFGTNGRVAFPPQSATDILSFRAVIIQPNGKIIIGGAKRTGDAFAYMLLRLNPNGTTDTSFGTNGFVLTTMSQYSQAIVSMALQPDGKLVVFGWVLDANNIADIGLARYLLDAARPTLFDFDGDGRADVSVFRPTNGSWYRLNSANNSFAAAQFGAANDKIAPADFDGDGRTDYAVFRDGIWFILQSSNNALRSVQFGQAGDIPVPADYDGDAKADTAVFRAGSWFVLNSANNSFRAEQFGIATDKPVIGDFDGDGKNDLAVYRDGNWYANRSSQGFLAAQFGLAGDKPVPADYDGDGKTDLAVFRNGTWYLQRSAAGFAAIQFGISTDKLVPADYDGDGRADVAVYRDGVWYQLKSASGFAAVQFGLPSDAPVPAAFLPCNYSAAVSTFVPHSTQNLAPGASSAWQLAHRNFSCFAPHSLQNFAPSAKACPHLTQATLVTSIFAPHSPQNFVPAGFGLPQPGQATVFVCCCCPCGAPPC